MTNMVTEYRCSECGKTLKTPQGLVQHARIKHDRKLSKKKAAQCTVEIDFDVVQEKQRSLLERLGFTEFHPVLLLIGIVLLGGGIPTLLHYFKKSKRKADASANRPSTQGEILSSRVKEPPSTSSSSSSKTGYGVKAAYTHVPRISYRYKVNGHEYQDNRPTFGHIQGKRNSEKFVAKFPKGAKVTVYYNPKEPSRAVLVRGMGGRNPVWKFVPVVVLMGLFFIVVAFRKNTG